DGDLDLFWGDFFEQGILLISNSGGCPHYSLRDQPRRFPIDDPVLTTGYNAPAPGDIDGDGDLDLLLGVIGGAFSASRSSVENLYLLEQVEPGRFRVATSRLVKTIDVGSESNPVLADIDGDGDLDLLVGSKIDPADNQTSFINWFENTGSGGRPQFTERGDLGVRGDFHLAPAVADLDGDGQPEIITGGWQDQVHWWRNTGTRERPEWRRADSALVTITRGSNTTPAMADLDGDGLPDLVVGEASGVINLYRNTGTRSAPAFTLVSDEFQRIDVGRRSAPHLADLDGDGRLDLLIGAEDGTVRLWRNVTTAPGEFAFEPVSGWELGSDPLATPTTGDLDGDGRLEVMVGTASGGIRYFRR
ncbi:MAG TPA: VCBS repeat-containing protein, partial [Gemmatimonadales bacterium]|nr:VCBS repeat-containing protein [Gemmatimonadales bacterium]